MKVIVSVVIFALCCGLGYSDSFAFWEKDLTYEGESVYNYLQVSEDDTSVRLSTNVHFWCAVGLYEAGQADRHVL